MFFRANFHTTFSFVPFSFRLSEPYPLLFVLEQVSNSSACFLDTTFSYEILCVSIVRNTTRKFNSVIHRCASRRHHLIFLTTNSSFVNRTSWRRIDNAFRSFKMGFVSSIILGAKVPNTAIKQFWNMNSEICRVSLSYFSKRPAPISFAIAFRIFVTRASKSLSKASILFWTACKIRHR